jgi:hypothetical protein
MFGVNLQSNNEIILDEELNELLEDLKVDYTQFYRGIVVDNLDPEYKGRVKVRIPQIYGTSSSTDNFLATSNIPWANCAISPAGNDSGTFLPPNIGDTVFVTFESGNPNSPIYFGGIYTVRSEDTQNKGVGSAKLYDGNIVPVGIDDLPGEIYNGTERVLYKSLKGAVIYIDDRDGNEKVVITDQSGQSIIMENLSREVLKRRGTDLGENQRSQIVVTNSAGDSITLSDGKIHLKSENIIFETDNFKQIGLDEFVDENNIADIILGKDLNTVTLNFIDMRTGSNLTGTTSELYQVNDDSKTLIDTYTYISTDYLDLDLASGQYSIRTILNDYYESNVDFTVEANTPQTISIYMTKETTEDNIQVVLSWNDKISDMDLHTLVYNQSGDNIEHVYYGTRDYYEDDIDVVNLDVDDTNYYGPETMTVNKTFNYKYLFYVHRFSSDNLMSTSDSVIKVYDKGRLVKEIDMKLDSSDDATHNYTYWKVCSYDMSTGEFEVYDTYSTIEPSI